ncbi:MAG TPA: prepilin-type N-terminal cleavage/methylation domain-containing protein [Candidatus Polarisedimenticolaceae bacterium]|nr:prepilin-type N-terminal cleavage/methylation domain-containing protein [Candidatus Polarisedimenticolaceae bacterium]
MRRRKQEGFSLIEVIIALALLAGVLIAIAGLFILGGKSVKSGRTSSEALATGKQIMEAMDGWGYSQLWGNFGLDGAATTYTVDTATCVTADCTSWQNTLASKLGSSAHATIKLDSVAQGASAVPNFVTGGAVTAKNVRVTVNVLWTQVTGRSRQVSIVTNRN